VGAAKARTPWCVRRTFSRLSAAAALPDGRATCFANSWAFAETTDTCGVSSVAMSTLEAVQSVLDSAYERGWVRGAGERKLETFPTGMTQAAGTSLRSIVQAEGARTTLETGFALGLSTLWIMGGTLAGGGDVRHVAVDPYQRSDWHDTGLLAVAQAGLGSIVEHVAEDSATFLPRLVTQKRVFDFMFVDGGHWFENAFLDLYFGTRLVKPGGLVVIDDLWMPAVQHAVSYFEKNLGLVRESRLDLPESRRFAILRTPTTKVRREWDHFEPFAAAAGAL
jgi:predicted O-methyltransferase YrrM